MRTFVSFSRIVKNVAGMGEPGTRICVIAGSEDTLVGVNIPKRLAGILRDSVKALTENKKADSSAVELMDEFETDEIYSDASLGVRYVVLKGAGHHFQNDIQQETGAKQLLAFIEQLR